VINMLPPFSAAIFLQRFNNSSVGFNSFGQTKWKFNVGDGRNNVANALMQGAAIMGMNFHLVCPKELNPTDELLSVNYIRTLYTLVNIICD
jgi:ornithine carbamoyltransferase